MSGEPGIAVNDAVTIPASEFRFVASRSGGPGGQNVNKVNSRMTLLFDVDASEALSDEQKTRIRSRLAARINAEGILQVSSQQFRTQGANREAATRRFAEIVAGALRERKRRKATRVPARAVEQRLEEKRARSERKRDRSRIE